MSIRRASTSLLAGRNLGGRPPWVRNPSWAALPDPTGLAKFVGLHAVYVESNFLALSASGSLGYTVDWGDGTAAENIATGVTAYHQYDYAAAGLASTNAPVTLTDAGDLVTRTAHGYSNGMKVQFYNIVTTTGLTANYTYFVISATANTFQVSLTSGGSAVALTTDGTATLLNYKQAIVSIVPQGAGTFTALNLNIKHNQTGLSAYSSGFLDIALAGSAMTTLAIGGTNVVLADLEQAKIIGTNLINSFYAMFSTCYSLQSVPVLSTAASSNFSVMFNNCYSLQSVPLFNTALGTNFNSMFNNCYSLQSVPLFNTALGTDLGSMFNSCYSLQSVPLFNTAAGTNFSNMFNTCYLLQSVPLFNTAAGTSFSGMFNTCTSLQSVPLFNTAAGTSFSSMFQTCYSLQSVPLFNTAAGTYFPSMFNTCRSLQSVPLFNTALGTDLGSMFQTCTSLQSVPLFNTALGTNLGSMFQTCTSLQSVPLFNTAAGTNFSGMFNGCTSLQSVPLFNTALGTNFSNMFNTCTSLASGALSLSGTKYAISYVSCKLSQTALQSIIDNLGTANTTGLVLTISTNWGAVTPVALTGATVAGSTTVSMASTTGITTGMQVTGTGTPSTTAIAVTLTDAGDTVNLTAHGLANGDEVSFATIVTTTGIVINKIYFVVGSAANTFQVALTVGGAAIALTTNGSGTLRYKATVSSIVVNTSVTLSLKATSTGSNTLSFRNLKTNTALLKGWAVTG